MAYNTSYTKYKSTYLAQLDCTATGSIKQSAFDHPVPPVTTFTASASQVLAVGECVAMVRVPAGTVIKGARLAWAGATANAVLAVGDPFCCGRLIGPVLTSSRDSNHAGSSGTWTDCGVLSKTGIVGDGCGIGYTYTCETDIIVTNIYNEGFAFLGGGHTTQGPATRQSADVSAGTLRLFLDVMLP